MARAECHSTRSWLAGPIETLTAIGKCHPIMTPPANPSAFSRRIHRRTFLGRSTFGLGSLALAGLLDPQLFAGPAAPSKERWRGVVNPPHFPIKAKRVIHLCMAGGPSQFESLDFKPELKRLDGQPFPESFTKGQQLAQLQNTVLKARGPFVDFRKHGQSGQEISDLFPNIAGIADDICIIRSMQTEQINHDPAHAFMNTGSIIKGRPSMGSWLLYGLGAETEDLPGFIVLTSAGKSGQQPVSARQWSAGFLPSKFQGILFQSKGDAVHYIGNPEGVCQSTQRQVVEEVNRLNGLLAEERLDPEIQTRISQYEMAFRMQASVPELTDFKSEPQHVLDLYGVKQPGDGSFASNCLLARRLAERGVRFIQLYHRAWDHHSDIEDGMRNAAREVDQASRRAGQRPEAARPARRHARPLGWRVRPNPDGPGHGPRPPHPRLLALDGRRRRQGRRDLRRNRRTRLPRRRGRGPRPRPPRHAPAPLRHRPSPPVFQISGPRHPSDRRRAGACRETYPVVIEADDDRRVRTPFGVVYTLVFSPKGATLMTGGQDNNAVLWDVRSGRSIGSFLSHRGSVMATAFSADGQFVLTASQDKTARLWDAASGKAVGPQLLQASIISAAAFAPDAHTFLTAADWSLRFGRIPGPPDDDVERIDGGDGGPCGFFAMDG